MSESRPFGEQERLFHHMHGFGALIPAQVLHIRGELEPALLSQGLAWLQREHPTLQAHIRYGKRKFLPVPPFTYREPFFETEGTKPIPLRMAKGAWQEVLSSELRTLLPKDRGPRLRVTLVRDATEPEVTHLVLCADHATVDAQSINLASRQLMEFLADPGAAEANAPTSGRLPPPLEAGLPGKSDRGAPFPRPIRLPLRPRERDVLGTRVVACSIGSDTTARLKSAARARGTTMHGIIGAAFLRALRAEYGRDELTFLSTIDLRRMSRPPIPAETYGCYVDILRTRHRLGEDFWGTARDVSFKLITALAKDHKSSSILRLITWDRYRKEAWATFSHRRRIDALTLTTAGDSGLRRAYGPLLLTGVTMSVSLDFYGPTMMVIASEMEGAIDFSVNFSSRVIAAEYVRRVAERAVGELQRAAAEPAHARQA